MFTDQTIITEYIEFYQLVFARGAGPYGYPGTAALSVIKYNR